MQIAYCWSKLLYFLQRITFVSCLQIIQVEILWRIVNLKKFCFEVESSFKQNLIVLSFIYKVFYFEIFNNIKVSA